MFNIMSPEVLPWNCVQCDTLTVFPCNVSVTSASICVEPKICGYTPLYNSRWSWMATMDICMVFFTKSVGCIIWSEV
jgi:transcription elongation factor Elf1